MKTSFIRFFRSLGIIFLLGITTTLILIVAINSYRDSQLRGEKMRANYVAQQKATIKREVEWAVQAIKFHQSLAQKRARNTVSQQVREAYTIAQNIYEQNKTSRKTKEIQQMILDAIRPIRFNNKKGYFFILKTDGTAILFADKPWLEGSNMLDVRDTNGQHAIEDLISVATKNEEGFYSYRWTKPATEGNDHEKVSFVKIFEPYNWVIGTGLYVEDVEKHVKAQVISIIEEIHFDKDGYVFIGQWDGISLVGPALAKGKNMIDVQDATGKKIVRELIRVAKNGSGYIQYQMPSVISSEKNRLKISYTQGIPEWQWYVGAGIYIDTIESEIIEMQAVLKQQAETRLLLFLFFVLILVGFFLFLFNKLNIKLKNDFRLFRSFFSMAAFSDVTINRQQVYFAELDHMAADANKMLQDKIHAQKDLSDEKERLYVTLQSISDAIITINTSEQIELMNPVAEQLTGWTVKEAKGKDLTDVFHIVHAETREISNNLAHKCFLTGEVVESLPNTLLLARTHSEYQINASAAPIRSTTEKIIGIVLIFRDITEENALQEKLHHSEKMDAIGHLAGGVAHDFNNMLAGIMGAAELLKLQNNTSQETRGKYIDLILTTCTRAAALTVKLLAFSRKGKVASTAVDIHKIIDDSVALFDRTLDKKISVSVQKNAENHIVIGDNSALQNCIMNLGINASHAMPDGGEIQIQTNTVLLDKAICAASTFTLEPGCFISIEIKDDGCGIPPKHLQKIFEPFFTTREQGEGTGLGLSAVYGTMQDHHGMITVYSEPGVGTSFNILLPCTEESVSAEQLYANIITGSGNILLVDDEEIIRVTGKYMLQQLGYTVLLAKNGKEAVEIYRRQHTNIDLVITDMIMPKMDGREVFAQLKAIDNTCKVIISSGFSKKEHLQELEQKGLTGFINKPFSVAELSRLLTKSIKPS